MKNVSVDTTGIVSAFGELFLPFEEMYFPFRKSVAGFEIQYNIFILLQEGACTVQYDSYPTIEVGEKEFFFIPYKSRLDCTVEPGTRLLVFRLPMFYELYDDYEEFYWMFEGYIPVKQPAISALPVKKAMDDFAQGISCYLATGMGGELFYEIKIRECLLILAAFYNQQELMQLFEPVVSRDPLFSLFIFRNWKKVKNVQELIGLYGYNELTFIRKFKEVFRVTPHKWLERERKVRILRELKFGSRSFKMIATEFGFGSLQLFNNYCQYHFNNTPGRIRQEE